MSDNCETGHEVLSFSVIATTFSDANDKATKLTFWVIPRTSKIPETTGFYCKFRNPTLKISEHLALRMTITSVLPKPQKRQSPSRTGSVGVAIWRRRWDSNSWTCYSRRFSRSEINRYFSVAYKFTYSALRLILLSYRPQTTRCEILIAERILK